MIAINFVSSTSSLVLPSSTPKPPLTRPGTLVPSSITTTVKCSKSIYLLVVYIIHYIAIDSNEFAIKGCTQICKERSKECVGSKLTQA